MTVLRVRRAVLVLLASVAGALLTLLSAAPATGHAMLIGTDPADGAVLTQAPDVVVLTFNEPIHADDGAIRLLDAGGEPLPTEHSSVDDTVEVDVPTKLDDGTYILDWRVTSADGHPVAGAFTFAIGEASGVVVDTPGSSDDGAITVLQPVATALAYAGLLGATGLVLFRVVLLDAGALAIGSRLRRVATTLGGLAVVGLVLTVLVDGAWRTGAGTAGLLDLALVRDTLTTPTGLATGLGVAGLVLALGLLPRESRGSAARRVGAGAGALLALASLALTGHTRSVGPAWLVIGSDVVHVLAASLWFGGMVGLGLVLRARVVPPVSTARTVSRFSTAAAWVVVVVGGTGVVLAWRILPSLDALVSTAYGLTLLLKVGAVGCILAIAAWNHFRLVPDVERTDGEGPGRVMLRRTVAVEAVLLVVVIVLTGVLVSRSPAATAEEPEHPTHETGTEGGSAFREPLGEATIAVHVHPASVGPNTLMIELTDADGAILEPQADPNVRLRLPEFDLGPLVPAVVATGPGSYEAPVSIPLEGTWQLEIRVRTSTYENPAVTLPLEVAR